MAGEMVGQDAWHQRGFQDGVAESITILRERYNNLMLEHVKNKAVLDEVANLLELLRQLRASVSGVPFE